MLLVTLAVLSRVSMGDLIMYEVDTWYECDIYQSEITMIVCDDYFELYETSTLWDKSIADI